jgi:nucleotide-binding universal stress UspA family protein
MAVQQHRIMFPIDFSNRCVSATRHVKTWVDRFGAILDAVHVVDAEALGLLPDEVPGFLAKRTADLKEFCDYYFSGTVVTQEVVSGLTADEIDYCAKRGNVDLIMLPRAHQNLGSRLLHDSVTATILERSASSVWVTEQVEAHDKSSIDRVLCAVHFERDLTLDFQNLRILEKIRAIADAFQAKVTFLNVVDSREEGTVRQTPDPQLSSGIQKWLIQMREQFGDEVEFLRQKGDAVSTIADIANQVSADLVVVGRSRPGTIDIPVQLRILKIDHAAHRPILSVW